MEDFKNFLSSRGMGRGGGQRRGSGGGGGQRRGGGGGGRGKKGGGGWGGEVEEEEVGIVLTQVLVEIVYALLVVQRFLIS